MVESTLWKSGIKVLDYLIDAINNRVISSYKILSLSRVLLWILILESRVGSLEISQ